MAQSPHHHTGKKPPSQRQLRVGEELRHAISNVFFRGECHVPEIANASITVSEVRVSPDLKAASAYVMPLGGQNKEALLKALNGHTHILRKLVSSHMALRYAPKLLFKLDRSFEEAARINDLLKSQHVRQDVEPHEADDAPKNLGE